MASDKTHACAAGGANTDPGWQSFERWHKVTGGQYAWVLVGISELSKLLDNSRLTHQQAEQFIGAYEEELLKPADVRLKLAVSNLTPDQRLKLFAHFCTHCGADDPKCTCTKDS